MSIKSFKLILTFRLLAISDVLFSKRFELTTFKNGRVDSKTKFDLNEIKEKL